MRNLYDLQKQLHKALRKHPSLHLSSEYPWNPELFDDVLWIIEDYINGAYGDHDTEELADWLDRYKFFRAGSRTSNGG